MEFYVNFIKVSILAVMITVIGGPFVNQPILADDDYEDHKYASKHEENDEDEVLEEAGELVGWGTVIAMGGAALILPLRRNSKRLIQAFPNGKTFIIGLLKKIGKGHIFIGATALILGSAHGIMMFLHEGEFGFREIIGTMAVGLMAAAAVFGILLIKNKGNSKARSIHLGFLFVAIILSIVHVIVA